MPDHTHDPHEVTVQLDGTGRRLEGGPVGRAGDAPGASGGPVDADGPDAPVFVDASGRRSRRFRRLGILVGVACAVYAVVIVATLLSGNSEAPWLPVPGPEDDPPAGQVHTSPLPTDPVKPSGASGAAPTASAAAGGGTAPTSDVAPTRAASGRGTPSGTPARSEPPASPSGKPEPSASGTKDPVVPPSPPASSPPAPTLSTGPSTSPSESPAGAGGTVADGPAAPHPFASAPGTAGTPLPENLL
ncbi:hypothetical protein [Streptomyces sp. NPDC056785]|uniref:hypothetical protein n=1 Tax=Streptomyces sp. NPDC056785 TaxID=3345944 RepID=UPI0036B3BBBC